MTVGEPKLTPMEIEVLHKTCAELFAAARVTGLGTVEPVAQKCIDLLNDINRQIQKKDVPVLKVGTTDYAQTINGLLVELEKGLLAKEKAWESVNEGETSGVGGDRYL